MAETQGLNPAGVRDVDALIDVCATFGRQRRIILWRIEMVTMNPDQLLQRITTEPGKCGGKPCIRGLRIRVADILDMLAANVPSSEILTDFPDLELEDIQAALIFAAQRANHARLVA